MLLYKYNIISDMYYYDIASTVDEIVREIAHFPSTAKYFYYCNSNNGIRTDGRIFAVHSRTRFRRM